MFQSLISFIFYLFFKIIGESKKRKAVPTTKKNSSFPQTSYHDRLLEEEVDDPDEV